MQLMRYFWDAAVALDGRAADLDEGRRFRICHPAALEALFRGAALQGVESRAADGSIDLAARAWAVRGTRT